MFSDKVKEEFCWSKSKVLFLPLLDKYFCENFFEQDGHYYIKRGSYVNRLVIAYGRSNDIDVDDLVGYITQWFSEALDNYTFDEVIKEDFDISRDAYVYTQLKGKLHNHLKYLKNRHKSIHEHKRHKLAHHIPEDTSVRINNAPFTPLQKENCLELDLSVLESDEKLVIDSYYNEGLKIKEIAQIMGKSEKTVKRIKSQALQRLYATNIRTE